MSNISRRDFLKGAAMGAAGLAALGLAGCTQSTAPTSSSEAIETTPVPQSASAPVTSDTQQASEVSVDIAEIGIERDVSLENAKYEADVVVVGSGTAGICAAVEASDLGGKTLLVEVASLLGGASNFAEGLLGMNTKYQQAQGIENNMDELAWSDYEFSAYLANYGLLKDFIYAADESIEWLESKGVKLIQPNPLNPHNTFQHFYDGQGVTLVNTLAEEARSNGVEILTETRAKRLCIQDGVVTGMIVEDSIGEFIIKTKSVILASGGFIHNDELWAQKYPYPKERIVVNSSKHSCGDGYLMAHAAGGDPSGICSVGWVWAGLKSFSLHSELSTAACNEPYFWINEEGERFIPENLLIKFSQIANAILSQRRVYSILTQTEVDRLMTEGCTVGWGSYIFAGAKLEDLQAQLDSAKAEAPEGFFYSESVEDLAGQLSINAKTLRESIESYNSMVEAGVDTQFGKSSQYLHEVPIEGPFYAFELLADATHAKGGIVINRNCEVIDTNAKPIVGLYAAGIDCSGLTGFTYYSQLGGSTQSFCVHTGRTAARNALALA